MVSGTDLVAQQDRGAAHALLDDPAALRYARNQLQHVVPLAVGAGIVQIAFQESAKQVYASILVHCKVVQCRSTSQ